MMILCFKSSARYITPIAETICMKGTADNDLKACGDSLIIDAGIGAKRIGIRGSHLYFTLPLEEKDLPLSKNIRPKIIRGSSGKYS